MPCYNAENFLAYSIESILCQTFKDFELIIIDDCSTDSSPDIIKSYLERDRRIIYLRNEKNSGVAASLNRGILYAHGEYIARMDADDISEPERLERQASFMNENPDCIVCGADIIIIDEKNNKIGSRTYCRTDDDIKKNILRMSPFAHPSVIMRRKILIKNKFLYTEDFPRAEDYDLWLRMADCGEYANLDHFLLKYRISDKGIKYLHCREILSETIRLKIKHLRRGRLSSYMILILEIILFLFPEKFILYLFKKRYGK